MVKREKTINYANEIICDFMNKCVLPIISGYYICSIVKIDTREETGFAVILQLSNRYSYTDANLNDVKDMLLADGYEIKFNKNVIKVKYIVHYDK